MSSWAKIAKNIVSHTPTKLSVKGGVNAQNGVISAFAEDLGAFLKSNKRKHISADDITAFYRERFPDINLKINNGSANGLGESLLGVTAKASTSVKTTESLSGVESFAMSLRSQSPLDKLKSFFHIPNKKKDFYVNSSFVNSLVHESTHVLQSYMKPSDVIYQRGLKNWTLASGKRSWEGWKNGLSCDGTFAYSTHVYAEQLGSFSPYKFRSKLMSSLRAHYYSDENLVKEHLKFFIRNAEAEKQAYTMGIRQELEFKYPRIAQTDWGGRLFDRLAHKEANSGWEWDGKIDAMKKEYFQLISTERAKHAAALSFNA